MHVFDTFMPFVGCKGWEVDTENHRNGNNLWSGSENDRISHKRKSSSRVSMFFFKLKQCGIPIIHIFSSMSVET